MKQHYVKFIADRLQCKDWQIENCALMFEDGNTIPFISRYRKEKTGGMDDAQVAEVKHWVDVFSEMETRKETVVAAIEAAGALTDALRKTIEKCVSSTELEDIYLPYRPKRRTRATVAKELGLEPLADTMWDVRTTDPRASAKPYVKDKVESVEQALAGARDIIAERLSETASIREGLRSVYRNRRIVSSVTKAAKDNPEADKYRSYFSFTMPLSRIPAHNLLAMLRAENEGFLSLSIDADPQRCADQIYAGFCHDHGRPAPALANEIKAAAEDSFDRLLDPSITNGVIKEAKQKADVESIHVFGENLRQLLLGAPVGPKRTMAIDPGFRNGCKIAVLGEHGELLHHTIIFPHPPQNEKVKALIAVQEMLEKYKVEAVAIGNGTASRETEEFMKKVVLPEGCKVWTVSEDGASIYSASEVARKEFPDEDVTVRGAVSIGRRLMDPLAELVKIDPKNLGVGQYQHDVDQALLKEKLDNTVESCVNAVGVNLNTASPYLLAYVAGIGPALAENIVAYRTANGGFTSRAELLKVPRLGAKAFEQCAGFLRIRGGKNPLDGSAVHPESYGIVDKMARDLGVKTSELVGNAELLGKIKAEDYVTADKGLPTINDILKELAKPGLDPREQASEFSFADDVHDISDLKTGMELPGIVTNITNFGAFVDIGLHENGLIHVSQMGVRGPVDPTRVVKLHQHVKVEVVSIDLDRKRIGLRLKR
ncbi:MAG: RNA-binding transcriptional accessory protein [Bacteroidales bacterium]|nr:RNA-binding transcriptional accessory protein [Bacteroidales bacterium]